MNKRAKINFSVALITLTVPTALMVAIALQSWVGAADLTQDPLTVAYRNAAVCCKIYYGAVSNLGILIWMSGSAICLFAGSIMAVRDYRSQAAAFLLAAGLLTGVLAVDDLYRIHENVLPALGIPEIVTYGVYAALSGFYLLASRRQIFGQNYSLLAIAIGLLGMSVILDSQVSGGGSMKVVLEDGAKLVGISGWVGFHIQAAWMIMATETGSKMPWSQAQRR